MPRFVVLLSLAVSLLGGCISSEGRLHLATLEGVRAPARPIQADVETRNCATRLLGLIPFPGAARATPEATVRRTLTQFPDGNAIVDASIAEEYRSYALLVDRHCWIVRGDVSRIE